jgi:hypothetical protein
MAVAAHGTVGLQHAAAFVRDFIKWDDLPVSLPHFAESAVRAYKIGMTPPMGPTRNEPASFIFVTLALICLALRIALHALPQLVEIS